MTGKLFGALVILLVAAGVAVAFMLIGSPAHARLVALDNRRVDDLQVMVTRITERYHAALPATLPPAVVLDDPQTHRPYTYRRTGSNHYTLCATFDLPSEKQSPAQPYGNAQQWEHRAGTVCFPQFLSE